MPVKFLDPKALRDDGYLQEANRQFFHPLGIALELDPATGIIKVWDYRDDPEGIAFDEKVHLKLKADRLKEIQVARLPGRKQSLGYWIQPVTE